MTATTPILENNVFGLFKKKQPPTEAPKQFPPVPSWRPSIEQPIDEIVARLRIYTNHQRDFAVFTHGTCVILPDALSDEEATAFAKVILEKILSYHPDMNPVPMKDGNVLVQYNHPAANLVLESVAAKHWHDIDTNHLRALATDEVLMTPQGSNIFDSFGKKALFGRCFMFMDAQAPVVVRIVRKDAQRSG